METSSTFADWLVDLSNDYPVLWAVYALLLFIPATALVYLLCAPKEQRLDVTSHHKKTDQYTPKDEVEEKSHDNVVMSHDHEMSMDDKKTDVIEVVEQTGEVTKNDSVVSTDNGITNGILSTSESHDQEEQSHDQNERSHDREEQSHDHEVSMDDKKTDVIEIVEQTSEVTKNDSVVSTDNGITNGTLSTSESHDQEEQSHDREEQSHDHDEKSHVKDEESHDQEEQSHDQNERSHDQNERSHDREEQSHDHDETSHVKDEESHDQENKLETVSHDQVTASDVTSHDNTIDVSAQETGSHDQSCDPEEQPPSDDSWEILNENEGNKEQLEVVENGLHLENGHDEVGVANGDLCDPLEERDSRWSFPPVLDQFDLMDTETDPAELEAIFADERLQEIYLDVTPEGPGLGISIVGGQGSPSGDLPIIVKRVLPGSLAEQDGRLKSGDELIAMNEKLLVGVGKDVAIDALSNLEGSVRLLVLQDE